MGQQQGNERERNLRGGQHQPCAQHKGKGNSRACVIDPDQVPAVYAVLALIMTSFTPPKWTPWWGRNCHLNCTEEKPGSPGGSVVCPRSPSGQAAGPRWERRAEETTRHCPQSSYTQNSTLQKDWKRSPTETDLPTPSSRRTRVKAPQPMWPQSRGQFLEDSERSVDVRGL